MPGTVRDALIEVISGLKKGDDVLDVASKILDVVIQIENGELTEVK